VPKYTSRFQQEQSNFRTFGAEPGVGGGLAGFDSLVESELKTLKVGIHSFPA